MAAEVEPGHRLLADIASLLIRHAAVLVESHFLDEGAVVDLGEYPGVLNRSPGLLAALLYRDHRRERDDVTVLALREAA